MELVEREDVRNSLLGWSKEAASGAGRFVLVAGEAGVGKTVLVQQFCSSLAPRPPVLTGACDPLSTPRPLGPLLDIASQVGGELETVLQREEGREAAFRSFLELLRRSERPTIVLFEDVHWADEATMDLLRFLCRRIDPCRKATPVTAAAAGPGHTPRMMRPTPRPISEPIEIRPVRARTGLRRTGLRGAALRIVALMLLVGTTACGGPTAPDAPDPDPDPAPPGSGSGEGGIALEQVAEGFVRPLGVVAAGAELYVLEQGGTVRVVEEDGTVRAEPFLDLRNHDFVFPDGEPETSRDERGLLGMAFRSGGTSEVFVHYNDAVGDTVVARMDVAGDEVPVADPGTEEELLTVPQDPDSLNHRGGQLAFGPDGMLYVALGDGGTGGDPATTPADRRGSILRLDPDAPANAYVPTDGENPFVDDPEGDPYVWHYGLRNPWRFSFDDGAETARMWIADVGQNRVEEVNVVAAGDGGHDFGWNTWEGDLCYPDPEGPCDPTGTTAPVLTYEADEESRKSITGGYVYRGTAVPALEDRYVFGDFVDGTIRAATTPEDGGVEHEVLLETEAAISSFGLDADGEILVLDYVGGVLYRIVAD